MFILKYPESKVKRELNSLIKTLQKGEAEMVEITRKGKVVGCLVKNGGDYQPPRKLFEDHSESEVTDS